MIDVLPPQPAAPAPGRHSARPVSSDDRSNDRFDDILASVDDRREPAPLHDRPSAGRGRRAAAHREPVGAHDGPGGVIVPVDRPAHRPDPVTTDDQRGRAETEPARVGATRSGASATTPADGPVRSGARAAGGSVLPTGSLATTATGGPDAGPATDIGIPALPDGPAPLTAADLDLLGAAAPAGDEPPVTTGMIFDPTTGTATEVPLDPAANGAAEAPPTANAPTATTAPPPDGPAPLDAPVDAPVEPPTGGIVPITDGSTAAGGDPSTGTGLQDAPAATVAPPPDGPAPIDTPPPGPETAVSDGTIVDVDPTPATPAKSAIDHRPDDRLGRPSAAASPVAVAAADPSSHSAHREPTGHDHPDQPAGLNPITAASRPVAAQAVTPPAPAMPASAADVRAVHDQILDHITHQREISEGVHELVLDLEPAELGRLRLELTMDKGTLHVQIRADDDAARHLLSSSLGDLRDALADAGVNPGHVGVDGRGANPSGGGRSDRGAAPADGPAPRARTIRRLNAEQALDVLL